MLNMLKEMARYAVGLGWLVCTLNAAYADSVATQGDWTSALHARDLDGNGSVDAYYDSDLNITWLADANYALTSGYTLATSQSTSGGMHADFASAWAQGLDLGGVTGWRLPTIVFSGLPGDSSSICQASFSGANCGWNTDTAKSELSHMYYVTLGNKAYFDAQGNANQPGNGLTNSGPFSNIQGDYWTNVVSDPNNPSFWQFVFDVPGTSQGIQDVAWGGYNFAAWAVHDGDVGTPLDVSSVPEPTSAALSFIALLLFGVSAHSRSRRTHGGREATAM
jgi:hypothetical protein